MAAAKGEDLAIKITLSQMIKRLLKLVPELPRLRLSSIDVAEIDEEFFDILKNEPRFMPYLHLSVQSGDDIILKRMKRGMPALVWTVCNVCVFAPPALTSATGFSLSV